MLQRKLDLEIDGSTQRDGQSLGHICVSVVFRSVSSVAMAGVCVRGCEGCEGVRRCEGVRVCVCEGCEGVCQNSRIC